MEIYGLQRSFQRVWTTGTGELHSRLFHAYITLLNSSVMLFHRRGIPSTGPSWSRFSFLRVSRPVHSSVWRQVVSW